MAAILSTDALVWVPACGGESAENAIVGGSTCDGEELHIIRGEHGDEIAVGKLHAGQQSCGHIPYFSKEIEMENYEVLTNPGGIEVEWVSVEEGGPVPTGAVEVGHCNSGDPFCVARRAHEEQVIPGKMLPRLRCIWVAHDGKEHCYSDYEVLCVKKVKAVLAEA